MKAEPDRLYLRAIEALRNIPGVVGVGSGFKITAGRRLEVPVLRVIVRKKRPLSEIPESERIPWAFEGLAIDVCEPYRGTLAAEALEPLQGGIEISGKGEGTLGCFGTVGPAAQKKTVLLTAGHVLTNADPPAIIGSGADIGAPDTSSSWCCVTGSVATVLGGLFDPEVDCGIAQVVGSGRPVQQLIRGLGPDKNGGNTDRITGVAPPRTDPDTQIQAPVIKNDPVKKVGATTGLTLGKVFSVDVAIAFDEGLSVTKQIMIDPIEHKQNLRKDGRYHFADGGDSGAVVVDEVHRVAALVTRRVDHPIMGLPRPFPKAGFAGIATDIHRVISTIRAIPENRGENFTIFASSQQGTQPTNAIVAGGAIHRLPDLTPEQRSRREAIELAKESLGTFALGRKFVAFILKHREEIRKLVNHHRRFTVAWHRAHGPAFLALFLSKAEDLDTPIPAVVEGTSVESGLASVQAELSNCASVELVDDMLPLWPPLKEVMPRSPTVRALIDNLRQLDAR